MLIERLKELKAQRKDKTKTRTEKDLIRKEIFQVQTEIARARIRERLEKKAAKEREKLHAQREKELARITALAEENPYFVLDGKDRWVDIHVTINGNMKARFQGKAWIQVPAATKAARWLSKQGRVKMVDTHEDGRMIVHFENGMEDAFE